MSGYDSVAGRVLVPAPSGDTLQWADTCPVAPQWTLDPDLQLVSASSQFLLELQTTGNVFTITESGLLLVESANNSAFTFYDNFVGVQISCLLTMG